MATKQELEQAIAEISAEFNAKLSALNEAIANEQQQQQAEFYKQRELIGSLEAKILQLQSNPSIPVEFNVDLSSLKQSLARLEQSTQAIAAIVPDEPVASVDEPVIEE